MWAHGRSAKQAGRVRVQDGRGGVGEGGVAGAQPDVEHDEEGVEDVMPLRVRRDGGLVDHEHHLQQRWKKRRLRRVARKRVA